MAVYEKGTYMTVGDLKEKLETFDDDLPVCHIYDGRGPLIDVIPSLNSKDEVTLVALHLGDITDLVEVDM